MFSTINASALQSQNFNLQLEVIKEENAKLKQKLRQSQLFLDQSSQREQHWKFKYDEQIVLIQEMRDQLQKLKIENDNLKNSSQLSQIMQQQSS